VSILFFGETGMVMFIGSGRAQKWMPAALALAGATFASSAALAQGANCTVVTNNAAVNAAAVASGMSQSSAAIAGAISAVETAFLTQQGSAFVSAPGNPQPNQPGGGIWIRGVAGEANIASNSTSTMNATPSRGAATPPVTANVNCNNNLHLTYGGVQVGADIARLNWNGWNVHLGSTAGYIGATTQDKNQLFPFNNNYEVPFLGTYLVVTKGRFFADVMVREEMFNINLGNAGLAFSGQPLSAHGVSVSASAGYNFDLKDGWFIEPSGGFIYSRTAIDPFTQPGSSPAATNGIPVNVANNDIISELGRLSLRAGRTIESRGIVWQPFASASVFSEFAGRTTASGAAPAALGVLPLNVAIQNSNSRIGTYGQYSVGVAGQVVNSGWLGYVRADYKEGENINGWGASAGLRYQFTPEMIAAVMPVKAKAPARPFIAPTSWTGFYVGGVLGADYGRTDVTVLTPVPQRERAWVAGALGGFEAGYNWQFPNNWVLGVEGDIVATNTHGARSLPPGNALGGPIFSDVRDPNTDQVGDRTNWIGTVTGRLGYAMQRTLLYVKAGAAFENSKVSVTCFDPVVNACGANTVTGLFVPGLAAHGAQTWTTQNRVGWTAGFGSEFDLGYNWSAKTEVDFLDFSRHTAVSSNGLVSLSDWNYLWQGKIGLNYRFGASPVVAKY
jgi:opacity protein-like surface antigen